MKKGASSNNVQTNSNNDETSEKNVNRDEASGSDMVNFHNQFFLL